MEEWLTNTLDDGRRQKDAAKEGLPRMNDISSINNEVDIPDVQFN